MSSWMLHEIRAVQYGEYHISSTLYSENKKSWLIRQYSVMLLHYVAVVCPRGASVLHAYVKLRRARSGRTDLVLILLDVMLLTFLMLIYYFAFSYSFLHMT